MSNREGYRSPKWGHLGVHFLCTGPDPGGPRPGSRLQVVIYDNDGDIVRRLEQEQGQVLDPGYVDFFDSPRCRPSVAEYHLVDIAPDGTKAVLATHTRGSDANVWLRTNFGIWATEHGIAA